MTSNRWLLCVGLALAGLGCGQQELSLCARQESSSSHVRLAPEGEPGEPLRVEGQVVVGKRKTPVGGVRILAYQTNAAGKYARDGSGYPGAYICGVVRTDAEGHFTFDTIRPGNRDGVRGQHIHFDVTLPWGGRHFDAVEFEDDPIYRDMTIPEEWKSYMVPVSRGADGVQRVQKVIWLRH